jgi:hypothetical protein
MQLKVHYRLGFHHCVILNIFFSVNVNQIVTMGRSEVTDSWGRDLGGGGGYRSRGQKASSLESC